MSRFTKAEITVFTFKEGLLSRVAHDLEIAVDSVELDEQLNATIDPRSLRVKHAMKKGRPDPRALSASDKKKIEGGLRDEVLHVSRFPRIRFACSEASEALVRGSLELHGVSRPVELRLHKGEARVRLHQPDFGITPFSAMMGALKVKPTVEVLIKLS